MSEQERKENQAHWAAEQENLGELPQPTLPETQAALERARAAGMPEHLRREDEAFWKDERAVRTEQQLLRAARNAEPSPARARRWQLLAPVFAVTAALLLVVGLHAGHGQLPADDGLEVGRVKGLLPSLSLFRVTPKGRIPLSPETPAHAGETVQIAYQAAGARYGAVLSVDGGGHITLHHPVHASDAPLLHGSGRVFLPFGYRLDDAPRFERFVLLTSPQPFSVSDVLDRLGSGAHLPDGVTESATFNLRKEER